MAASKCIPFAEHGFISCGRALVGGYLSPVAEIHGECDDRFGAVRETLAEFLDTVDVGASAAVFVDGEPVADLWGGYVDLARTVSWERDTITCVFSVSKTMVALCALILADRGSPDLDAQVAKYWPEFAAEGKDGVLVRHVLAHTSGLPEFDEPVTASELYDWPAVTARLAAQAPRWEPGTQAGYHSITQGFLLGEVIRRITGRDPGAFFAEDVAGPLGADFHLGLPPEHDGRVAPVLVPQSSPTGDWIASAQSASEDPGPTAKWLALSSTTGSTRSSAGQCGGRWVMASSAGLSAGAAGADRW